MARLSCSFALGISAALILAGVVAAPPAVAETVLRIANLAEPASLDPHKYEIGIAFNIVCNLFEGLVVLDPKGRHDYDWRDRWRGLYQAASAKSAQHGDGGTGRA